MKLRGASLLIPLKPGASSQEIASTAGDFSYSLGEDQFEETPGKGRRNLAALLSDLEPSKLALIPRSYDVIGDIAVIELPPQLDDEVHVIGEALMRHHRRVKAVYAKAGPVTGEYRIRKFRNIAGEAKEETVHRENGCVFKLNIQSTFFNPRLGGERLRVARQVAEGQSVLDMFSGVGPFSILIAKLLDAQVYAVDNNPEAVRYLNENLRLNHVERKVKVMQGDAASLASSLEARMDHVIMNLPERASEYVGSACRTIKPEGGVLHFYTFQKEPDPTKKAEALLSSRVDEAQRSIKKVILSKAIREIAARNYHVVVDAEIA